LGKRTGFEGKVPSQLEKILSNTNTEKKIFHKENFDKEAQQEFLKGAKIAYETIITDFSDNDNKLIASKPLLSKKIHDQFDEALKERSNRNHYAEITFIGVNSANIKEHKKIISGDPEKIKKIYDTWVFSRNIRSNNPNWQLVDTLT
jgi:predicted lipid-binding transport protein (Tim44 family)